MATFVLVHGAWLGGWCWKYVAPALRSRGHEVFTPTLTGLGERRHLARPEIDLSTHVSDVANVLDYEELTNVVLVGHSYAGLVVSGVVDREPKRIDRLVYLDGMIPRAEEPTAMFDLGPPSYREAVEAEAAERGDGWRWPMPEEPEGWVGIGEADARWMRAKAVPHPIETFSEPVDAHHPSGRDLPTTLVLCTENGMSTSELESLRVEAGDRGWECIDLETGHWPMVSTPEDVAELLDERAR